jgi:hypothetical protein
MEALAKFFDSQAFAAIIGALIGIIPTAWYAKIRKKQEDRLTYLGWLNGLSAETEHISKVIKEITTIFQSNEPGVVCTKRMNHDFLEKARLAIFGYDEDVGFLETLTNAYRDVLHTNDMIDRHERAVISQSRVAEGIHGSVLASMQGVSNSVSALKAKLAEKLSKIQNPSESSIRGRITKYLRLSLQFIGGLTLLGAVVIAVWLFSVLKPGHAKSDHITPEKAAFILNWADIGNKAKISKVLHSYQSARSFTGDHVDAYSLQIDHFPEEVVKKDEFGHVYWIKPPLQNRILKETINTAALSAESDNLNWFPSAKELNSARFYLRFQMVLLRDQHPSSVQLTAYDRIDHKIYHIDVKL